MRKVLMAAALTGLSMLCCAAHADTFNFSATALGASFSGVLTATNNNDGSFLVTAVTGPGIAGLIGKGDPFFGNDNFIFPGGTRALDVNGLAFTGNVAGQIYSLDIYSTVSGYQVLALDSSNNIAYDNATFSMANAAVVTPEPSSLILLGTGMLSIGAAVSRRRTE